MRWSLLPFALVACAARPTPVRALAPLPDARLEAMLAALETVSDWRSTVAGRRAPNPVVATRLRRAPFRRDAVARIEAFHLASAIDGAKPAPFTREGRLDPAVIASFELDAAERARVVALLAPHHGPHLVFRCGFDPHHVLVFYDASGIPMARLLVCFTCGEVQLDVGGEPRAMRDDERATLEPLFDAHAMTPWAYLEDDPRREALRAYEERVYGTEAAPTPAGLARRARRDARPSGVSPDVLESRLPASERARFCTWMTAEIARRAARRPVPSRGFGGFECAGRAWSLDEERFAECAPIGCEVPMWRIEACARARFLDGPEALCREGLGSTCAGLERCIPGVVWYASR